MMWLAVCGCCPARDHVLHANTTLVDRVDLATPAIAVLSTGYRPLGSCSRAAGWSAATLCSGPTRTSGEVRYCAAVRGTADLIRATLRRGFVSTCPTDRARSRYTTKSSSW